jgi:two-component system, OmpR family, response regulator
MRVLYVDDDRINTLLFVETCRFVGGVDVETAGTGAEALEQVAAWVPDLLVLDLHLPDTTGYALLPQLRSALGLAQLPAVLCTADTPSSVEGPAHAAGFHACWAKPVDLKTVLAELNTHRTAPTLGAVNALGSAA